MKNENISKPRSQPLEKELIYSFMQLKPALFFSFISEIRLKIYQQMSFEIKQILPAKFIR